MKNANEQLAEAGSKFKELLPEQIKSIQEFDRDNRLNGNASKIDFYRAVAELAIEIIVIQAGVFYKPAFKLTGAIFRNAGLSSLAFRYPSLISHMMSCVHWYLRNWMVDETSELAGELIQELEDLNNSVNEERR